jgi:hypothetical protein
LLAECQILDQGPDRNRRQRKLLAVVVAILIAPMVAALSSGPASAQANPPSGVGSLNDYMHQNGDGPSGTGVPPPAYRPQPAPPQSVFPQTVTSQEWNRYADPDSARNALIGTAVIGALVVGMLALQQQHARQAEPRARKRLHAHRPAHAQEVE